MMIVVLSLMFAATEGPPPYPRALQCAGLTRAWADLEQKGAAPGAGQAVDDADFWASGVMDAARRDGVAAGDAEAATLRTTLAARKRFELGDANAARELLDCQIPIPSKPSTNDPPAADAVPVPVP